MITDEQLDEMERFIDKIGVEILRLQMDIAILKIQAKLLEEWVK